MANNCLESGTIICPWCMEEHDEDSYWDFPDEIECTYCGGYFYLERELTYTMTRSGGNDSSQEILHEHGQPGLYTCVECGKKAVVVQDPELGLRVMKCDLDLEWIFGSVRCVPCNKTIAYTEPTEWKDTRDTYSSTDTREDW